jgi:hypothetical protein
MFHSFMVGTKRARNGSGPKKICRHATAGQPDERLVEIVVPLDLESWHGYSAEALWAEPVAERSYMLRSAPFYAFDLAAEDLVTAKESPEGLILDQVQQRSGGSTYRLFVRNGTQDKVFEKYWAPLEELDCNFEETRGNLVTIDVPPQAEIEDVYAFLEEGESAGVWEFEEGHCGHPLEHSYASWRPRPV